VLHGKNEMRGAFEASCHHQGEEDVEFSCSHCLTIPAARRPALDTSGTSGAPTTAGSKETVGKAAYAAVVAGDTNPRQPSVQPKPTATGSDSSEPAASSEAANRLKSVDMSGSMGSMPAGTTEAGVRN
jgi:hypothetical protein